ncbi:hypothetical protein Ddc_14608 [Ditylenchus destructor]|nr:hypothetical protein Ddc_14608 [Ditylenchus destructor]
MNYMLLVNVLEYFDRENLEKLSIVSRLFEKIVRIEFPQHPFRVFYQLHIATCSNGAIGVGMENKGITIKITSITPPETNVAEFKAGLTDGFCHAVRHFSVRAMLPFMTKSVRFWKTIIEVNSTLISQQSITAMENFAHLWTGGILEIRHGYDIIKKSSPNYRRSSVYDEYEPYKSFAPHNAIIPSCERIFNSPGVITPCRELQLYRISAPLSVYPGLYALKFIKINEVHEFWANNLLDFVEGFSKYNSTTLLICFSDIDFQRTHQGIIRDSFCNSKETHAWKLILVDVKWYGGQNLIEFRDENLLTKDVLEFRKTDNQLKEDLCTSLGITSWCALWILERKPF